METEKDDLLRNVPLEIMDRVRRLAERLWTEKNPAAVQLSVIVEEFDSDVVAAGSAVRDYAKHYEAKLGGLRQELQTHRARAASLEENLRAATDRTQELISELERCEAESSGKYTKEAVLLLEQQIAGLKKELADFRRLKGQDDHRIMELEELARIKGDEVERRFVSKVGRLAKESEELRAANSALEKAKADDDASIRGLRAALEKSERESREKYTRAEVELLEKQIADLKKEAADGRRLRDAGEKVAAGLQERLKEKNDEVEKRFIGKISLLETRAAELEAAAAEQEKAAAEKERRLAELKQALAVKERELAGMYTTEDMKRLEETLAGVRQELAAAKSARLEDEKKIAALERAAGESTDGYERRYAGKIAVLEERVEGLGRELAAAEAAGAAQLAKAADLKKELLAREKEGLELRGRLADADMACSAKLAEAKEAHFQEQRRQGERIAALEADSDGRTQARRAALEADYQKRLAQLREREAALAAAAEAGNRELEARKKALDEELAASKRELAGAFEKVRGELERREAELAERAAQLEAGKEAARLEMEARRKALEEEFAASKRELVRTFDKVREEVERREAALA